MNAGTIAVGTWQGRQGWPASVYLTEFIDDSVLLAVREGSVAVLLQSDNKGSTSPYPTTPTRFKQAWWLGNAKDNNAGTLVYDVKTDPILGGMAPEGKVIGF